MLARAKMRRESAAHTLDATALVHEAYLRLIGGDTDLSWKNRGHFFGAAAEAMRRVLIDNARRKQAENVYPLAEDLVLQISGEAIQIARPRQGAAKTIVPQASGILINRAPNGKSVLVRYYKNGSQYFLVVDSEGNVIVNRAR